MSNRRNFLGKLGLGAAAALVAKPLAGLEIPKQDLPTLRDVPPELVKPLTEELKGIANVKGKQYDILRIANRASVWCKKGLVEPGHWFTHQYGEKTCVDMGSEIDFLGYRWVGYKAMRFNVFEHGGLPDEVYLDPKCDGYRKIVEDSKKPYPAPIGSIHGPVFVFFTATKGYELFCLNNTMRRFAEPLSMYGEPNTHMCVGNYKLSVMEHLHPRGWQWFGPWLIVKSDKNVF